MQQTEILIGLFICHFLADYTHLSTSWMLSAKRLGKPLFPIFCHATIHSVLMGFFLQFYVKSNDSFNEKLFILIAFQLGTHFLIDVWKGRMNGWFPALQSPANKWHWIIFGFDQFLHAVVIIIMSYLATKN